MTNPNSIVARVLKAKYYPQCDYLKAKQAYNPSFTWQSIQKGSWLLKKGCIWNIGDGKAINIWEDRWIHPNFGSTTWSKPPADTPYTMVNDLIDNQNRCWKENIIQQLFYPPEASLICSIPIMGSDQEDFISWQGTRDGEYSVKSGYQAIINWQHSIRNHSSSNHLDDNPRWKKLWKLFVPPKQIHFIWRILNNAVPVKEKLFRKGIKCVPLCSYCNSNLETMDHIFLECEWAKQAWLASPLTINTEQGKIKHIQDWIEYMISETKAEDLQIISTILYSIWKARNDREFNGKFIPPDTMMQRAIQVLHEFQSNQSSKALPHPKDAENTRHDISWSLPPNGALKLNVDAHSLSDGRWGLGLLLRRDDGGCVGAATRVRKGTECALLAEAMGLQEAVELIQQWNLQNTIIELDARVIVDAFHKSLTPRTIWGNLVNLCAKKVRDRKDVAVVWTRRSGNNATHELANWAGIEPNREWRSNFPSCITYHIQKDMGVTSLS
jgi:hypothetical protein